MTEQAEKVIADILELAKRVRAVVDGLESLACAGVTWIEAIWTDASARPRDLACSIVVSGDGGRSPVETWLTVEQVATMIGEKADTVYAKASRGEIPHLKTGIGKSGLRFLQAEIIEWGKRNAQASQGQRKNQKRHLRAA